MQPFDLLPVSVDIPLLEPDTEPLQGWAVEDPHDLCTAHPLPALLEFELLRNGTPTGTVFSLRGPAATVGRYTPQTGPVDIDLGNLQEYERLHIGLPHIRVGREFDGWRVEALTPYYPTHLDGEPLTSGSAQLPDGALLVLGDVSFRVQYGRQGNTPAARRPTEAGLWLKRECAPTQLVLPLHSPETIVGRYSPSTGPVDMDLGGLPDMERVHIARRHARIWWQDEGWHIEPLSNRPIFINRNPALQGAHALTTGDEVALGNVLFLFVGANPENR